MSYGTVVIDAIAEALAAREEDQRLAQHPDAREATKLVAREDYEWKANRAVDLMQEKS